MSNSERVDKFHEDSIKLLQPTSQPLKLDKILSEITKLQKWLFKHQDENLPSGHKDKLLTTIQAYYSFTVKLAESQPEAESTIILADKTLELVEDLCKLP